MQFFYIPTFNKKTLFVDFYLFFFCSSIVSFYGPLTVMCVTYFRIYKAAVAHTKSLRLGAKQLTTNGSEGHGGQEVVLRMHRGGGTSSASAAGTPNGHRQGQVGFSTIEKTIFSDFTQCITNIYGISQSIHSTMS